MRLEGWIVPRCDRVPITMDAASAPETKKIATSVMATPRECRRGQRVEQAEQLALERQRPRGRCRSLLHVMAAPPKMANHTRLTVLGTRMTPETNSRMVRPRLIRAMKMPTNGVQEIHQAQ